MARADVHQANGRQSPLEAGRRARLIGFRTKVKRYRVSRGRKGRELHGSTPGFKAAPIGCIGARGRSGPAAADKCGRSVEGLLEGEEGGVSRAPQSDAQAPWSVLGLIGPVSIALSDCVATGSFSARNLVRGTRGVDVLAVGQCGESVDCVLILSRMQNPCTMARAGASFCGRSHSLKRIPQQQRRLRGARGGRQHTHEPNA